MGVEMSRRCRSSKHMTKTPSFSRAKKSAKKRVRKIADHRDAFERAVDNAVAKILRKWRLKKTTR